MDERQAYEKVMARALRLLSAKARSKAELRERLLEKAPTLEYIVDRVIARIEELGYLNDEQLARDLASSRLQLKPIGRRRLKRELKRKQIPENIVEGALDEAYDQNDPEQLITRAIQKRTRTRGRPETREEAKKLFDYLIRLGFDYDLARRKVIEAARTPVDDE